MTSSHHAVDPRGHLIRPYAVTRGRTESTRDIAVEAILITTTKGRQVASLAGRDKHRITNLCDGRALSLAEVASYARMPLGVARVLVADMASEGLLALHDSGSTLDYGQRMAVLEEVLRGLRRL